MAEQHRRVEPRSIIGTGMATDPERLRDIEERAARFERDRTLPRRKFGEVMSDAGPQPPPGTELVDAPPPERERKGAKPKPEPAPRKPPMRMPPPGVKIVRPPAAAAPKPETPPADPAQASSEKPAAAPEQPKTKTTRLENRPTFAKKV
ncbi:MAG: hypothetical protein AB2A00_26295 [Myxococcota bacterium]